MSQTNVENAVMNEEIPELLATPAKRALSIKRFFTKFGRHPFEEIDWELRTASIQNEKGEVIFEQREVEVPREWSQTATNIVASKYFHGKLGTAERESSVRRLITRVADTIAQWGVEGGYFVTQEEKWIFRDELIHLLVRQKASFNSPVWFNCGLWQKYYLSLEGGGWYFDPATVSVKKEREAYRHPQCSACFINSVQDNLESILCLARTEGMLFKYGSGTGTNLSPIRSSLEGLSGGGVASGPLSFMKGYDAFAGVIKSGGKTRRAAKMVILNIDHPDVVDFIECKAKEERKAQALIDAGYDASLDGEAYSSIFFQNANNSVRVTDEFMQAVVDDVDWVTRKVTTGEPMKTYRARELMRKIAEAAWHCGDPGMQFDTTINKWHTCKATGSINASNPCSEYMFLDDSACNLASLNLMKFLGPDGGFNTKAFCQAVDVMIIAQEILVDNASYPTEKIAQNSHDFRPVGLGYANLGALLMATGLPYDSEGGRSYAAAITALMHGEAYLMSSRIAEVMGAFPRYSENRDAFTEVIGRHREAVDELDSCGVPPSLREAYQEVWKECVASGVQLGFRNAQVTVLAPTGTIAFMMDCDTTGIEPDLALVKFKKLVGGGLIKIVNNVVHTALKGLGYGEDEVSEIGNYIKDNGTIEGAPHLKVEHLPVFDCSLTPANGKRSIHSTGHVQMMAAVQPFLSGAISKTVNLPTEATAEDIANVYQEAWRLGLKAIAVYRDGSKRTQPLNAGTARKDLKLKGETTVVGTAPQAVGQPVRRRLPDERKAMVHHFSVGGHEGYLMVGMYEDGQPGEIFIRMAKAGSTIAGLTDSFGIAISLALQYGVPLKVVCDKFSHTRFEPSGWSGVKEIGYAKSIMDYISRWLALKFLPPTSPPPTGVGVDVMAPTPAHLWAEGVDEGQADAPACRECGAIMSRNGSCYRCGNCGWTSGCS